MLVDTRFGLWGRSLIWHYHQIEELKICKHQLRIIGCRRFISSDYYDIEVRKDPGHWKSDPQFQRHIGVKKWTSLRGTSRKQPLYFFSPSSNPTKFGLTWFGVFFLIYCIFSLGSGETLPQRRRRVVQDRLYQEYGINENELDEIEGMEEASLSDDDAESYGAIMDPLLEPKEDTLTAKILEPWFGMLHKQLATDPLTSNYPAIMAYEQLQQKRKDLPVEIRDFVRKTDSELLVDQLLERKDQPALSSKMFEFPGEADDEIVRLPRKIEKIPTSKHRFV